MAMVMEVMMMMMGMTMVMVMMILMMMVMMVMMMMMMENDENDDDDGDDDDDDGGDADDICISAYLPEDSPLVDIQRWQRGGPTVYSVVSFTLVVLEVLFFSLPVVLIYKNMICQQR
jgi:hypothetical protein